MTLQDHQTHSPQEHSTTVQCPAPAYTAQTAWQASDIVQSIGIAFAILLGLYQLKHTSDSARQIAADQHRHEVTKHAIEQLANKGAQLIERVEFIDDHYRSLSASYIADRVPGVSPDPGYQATLKQQIYSAVLETKRLVTEMEIYSYDPLQDDYLKAVAHFIHLYEAYLPSHIFSEYYSQYHQELTDISVDLQGIMPPLFKHPVLQTEEKGIRRARTVIAKASDFQARAYKSLKQYREDAEKHMVDRIVTAQNTPCKAPPGS